MWLDLGQIRIGLIESQEEITANPVFNSAQDAMASTGVRHVVFAVPDVDHAYATLLAKGVEFMDAPTTHAPPGIRIVYLRDPDGNVVGLYEETDPANAIGVIEASKT